MTNNPKLYYNLLHNYPSNIPSPFTEQIEMDLLRTYPGVTYFKSKANINKLRNVLLAVSRRNVSIGYVQGFNFMVGKLLMLFDSEEESFWIFTQIIEEFLPLEFYIELAGILTDCAVAVRFLKEDLPDVVEHLTQLGGEMCLNNVLFQWFDSLFVQNMNAAVAENIWDLLFLEGNLVIFKAAIAIFTIMKGEIMAIDSMEDVFNFFETATFNIKPKQFMKEIMKVKFTTEPDLMRKHCMSETEHVLKNSFDIKASLKKKSQGEGKECKVTWPVCVGKGDVFEIPKVSVIRKYDKIAYEDNYFNGDLYKKNQEEIAKKSIRETDRNSDRIFKEMLIERQPHTCAMSKKDYKPSTSHSNSNSTMISMKSLLANMTPYHENDYKPETSIARILKRVDSSKHKQFHIIHNTIVKPLMPMNSPPNKDNHNDIILEDSD